MKRWVGAGLITLLIFSVFSITASAASRPPSYVSVVMDGQKFWFPDAQAFIDENGRTLVPVRFIAESLGAKVGWESKSQTIPIERSDQSIILTIGSNLATVNGKEVAFDTKAILNGGRTFVPLRFVSEVLGATVEWDNSTSTVFIFTKEDANSGYDEWGRLIRTDNLPKNAKDYPYILADVSNEMYEIGYPYSRPGRSKVAAELYTNEPEYNKGNIDIWMKRLKTFGALWLNIDYKTIDDTWAKAILDTKMRNSDAELKYLREYVDWVKKNQIQVIGYLDPEPSMIFHDGFGADYIRTKFRIQFISFQEPERLIYDEWFPQNADFEKQVWYEGYTDIKMTTNVGGDWGSTLKVSPTASLFFNHTISKVE
ncbi:copper amine oxidase N-terminal domain-containing protein [Paenibacillus sp. FSL K6-3166]|uniref:copper amine oxidase N-terminal domain-containing protein n=1 Tax=unclassified Paenibacillus TaxID=185978 RepID=UPI000BA0171F|nr:copper amine oxidase N-terminal domain-containing protein [Paenibacillus sp. VTT E-133291]OZQ91467.1 copper amine oxidase [Paenibacillus sp. VTT E-133291]